MNFRHEINQTYISIRPLAILDFKKYENKHETFRNLKDSSGIMVLALLANILI